jgi:hypothetical protein
MSYELNLHFDPPVVLSEYLQFFVNRKNYTAARNLTNYRNADTGVAFSIEHSVRSKLFGAGKVDGARFEVNYFRPSFFGLESEIELSALLSSFTAKIDDPQIEGMGHSPYSEAGFLRGWNFGNAFAVKKILGDNPQYVVRSMPASRLHAAWTWNIDRAKRLAELGDRQFVPLIMPLEIKGTPRLAAVWGAGISILLPTVEYVLVGREVGGQKRFGLAAWSEVVELAQQGGFDTSKETLDFRYLTVPVAIARWFADIPEVDVTQLPKLSFVDIIDSELVPGGPSLAPRS